MRHTPRSLPFLSPALAGCLLVFLGTPASGSEPFSDAEPGLPIDVEIALPEAAAPLNGPIACGGIADPPCPSGSFCADVPDDGCSPSCGGADCPGFCATLPAIACGGIAGIPCPGGLTCIDDVTDTCIPDCGGADCPGLCMEAPGQFCAGIANLPCPSGFACVDATGDACHPDCGGADCGGECVRPTPFCGGIASIPCPEDLVCIDDPADACENDCGGADCSGICVDPLTSCGRSAAPECGGACPDDQACVPSPDAAACVCLPPEPPCQLTSAPLCGGVCPDGSRCAPAEDVADCACRACTTVVPGSGIELVWPGTQFMVFDPLPCATSYNAYRSTTQRLEDADGDGLADSYGSCFDPDLTIPVVAAGPDDPPSRFMHLYLVTGENEVGEGTLGFNSLLVTRPNVEPCP